MQFLGVMLTKKLVKRSNIELISLWMSLEIFNSYASMIVDKEFPTRELPIIFCISIKMQVNEIYSERHLLMYFEEFLEAICRIIDKSFSSETKLLLSEKIKLFMPRLINSIGSEFKNIKEKFVLPSYDYNLNLYRFDPRSYAYNASYPRQISIYIFIVRIIRELTS